MSFTGTSRTELSQLLSSSSKVSGFRANRGDGSDEHTFTSGPMPAFADGLRSLRRARAAEAARSPAGLGEPFGEHDRGGLEAREHELRDAIAAPEDDRVGP